MKAVVLCGKGQVEYREVEKPVCGDDDIILEVKACGICGSDLHFYYGRMDPLGPVPFTMGHEFAGVIAEVGQRDNGLLHGRRIYQLCKDSGKAFKVL